MASIFDLLNPPDIPSPSGRMSPKTDGGTDGNEAAQDATASVGGEAKYYNPFESMSMQVDANNDHTDAIAGDILADRMQASPQTNIVLIEESRPRISEGEKLTLGLIPNVDGSRGGIDTNNRSRRTSASSLADVLNPIEKPAVVNRNGTAPLEPQTNLSAEHSSIPVPFVVSIQEEILQVQSTAASHPPSPMAVESEVNNDEEMKIDVTVLNDEHSNLNQIGNPSAAIKDSLSGPLNNHPIQSPLPVDSKETILDTIDNVAPSISVKSPSPTSSPSRKRKLTPESSPEELLSAEPQDQAAENVQAEPGILSQISVERPQPSSSRATKKPKRPPVKKPASAKKKSVTNGKKKSVAAKRKEKSESVGFDDVPSLEFYNTDKNRTLLCPPLDSPVLLHPSPLPHLLKVPRRYQNMSIASVANQTKDPG